MLMKLLDTLTSSNASDSNSMSAAQMASNRSDTDANVLTGQEVCSMAVNRMKCGLSQEYCGECSKFIFQMSIQTTIRNLFNNCYCLLNPNKLSLLKRS